MKIALVNANGGYGNSVSAGNSNAGLNTLDDALKQEGHCDIKLFPEKNLRLKMRKSLDTIVKEVSNYKPDLVGISCMSEFFFDAIYLGCGIKESTGATVIAGGPHFQADPVDTKKMILNSIVLALFFSQNKNGKETHPFDGVVVGEGQPFVDVANSLRGKLTDCKSIEGLYLCKDNQMVGGGRGAFPKVSKPPYAISRPGQEESVLHILGNPSCPNDCGYCSLKNFNTKISPEMIASAIASENGNFDRISLSDSNPFFRPAYYETVFKLLRSQGLNHDITAYLDPSLLMSQKKDKILEIVQKYRINHIFLGRETASENVARNIGRNWLGKPRTQKRLDKEHEEISELLQFLGGIRTPYMVKIAYILSPFDDFNSISRIVDEYVGLKENAPKNVNFKFVINTLMPFPGTAVRERNIECIEDPNNFFDFYEKGAYSWKKEMFPKQTNFFLKYNDWVRTSKNPDSRFEEVKAIAQNTLV